MKSKEKCESYKKPKSKPHPRRIRVQLGDFEPSITDQSAKQSSNMNYIMSQYLKTGLLPESSKRLARYIDNTNVPSLEDAYTRLNEARELFMLLPAKLRKQIDNDPKKLPAFLVDPDNKDQLIKLGIINPKPKVDGSTLPKPATEPVAPPEKK